MVLAERLIKMISAKEAKKCTDEATSLYREGEYSILINDIEEKIQEAVRRKKYSIGYWWSHPAFVATARLPDSDEPIASAQLDNPRGSFLYSKIKDELIEAGYDVEEQLSGYSAYCWTIKWG